MLQLIGRRSSHFTRVTRIFAAELGVEVELVPVFDIASTDSSVFAGNPALKLPTLRRPTGALLFGAENICRALAEGTTRRIVWPEHVTSDLARNAQELVWHSMAAQVQWVLGTLVNRLPAENAYFAKGRAGFEGALGWLEEHLPAVLAELPADRELSVFEVTLFCLVEHLTFRGTLQVSRWPGLARFAKEFSGRASAQSTAYAFDVAPA